MDEAGNGRQGGNSQKLQRSVVTHCEIPVDECQFGHQYNRQKMVVDEGKIAHCKAQRLSSDEVLGDPRHPTVTFDPSTVCIDINDLGITLEPHWAREADGERRCGRLGWLSQWGLLCVGHCCRGGGLWRRDRG